MKNLVAVICLILGLSAFSSGFVSPDFSGNWIRDAGRSDSTSILSSLVVRQSDASLDIESAWNQDPAAQRSEIQTAFGTIVRTNKGQVRFRYLLDGAQHSVADDNGPNTYRVIQNGNQMTIESNRTIKTPFGSVERAAKEECSLSADGMTLTIVTTTNSPSGDRVQKDTYTKQE